MPGFGRNGFVQVDERGLGATLFVAREGTMLPEV